ncbi:MAG: type I DNA topoisomerase [Ruminococcaceae bacterium]|nr:type I DNA topoisomerase [Oscillospiraceae bacterium]
MAKNLIIVESPAKAKTIKKYLGRDYNVVASFGHLRDLPKSQLGIDVENNFEPRYITIRGKGDLLATLKKEAKAAEHVFLATDPDREGEAISWHLAHILGLDPTSKCRITFNEITKDVLKAAVKDPHPINLDLVDAQQARRVLDRIVGYKLSPLLWRKVKKGLSAGRVQSVVTRLVVEREREIEQFIPDEYWTINAQLKGKDAHAFKVKFHGKNGKKFTIRDAKTADTIFAELQDSAFQVSTAKYDERKKSPAPPFTTSTMQQEAARRLNYTSRKTMSAAQILYEGVDIEGYGTVGLITYMRTDSLRISAEASTAALSFIRSRYGAEYAPLSPRAYKSRAAAQDAHEAIRPTHIEITPEIAKKDLTSEQYKLYKLIWERFMASQMADAIYNTLQTDITAGNYLFKASFAKVKFPGFESVYKTEAENEEESTDMPSLRVGDSLTLKKLEKQQNFTEPPSRYTEGALIRAMEEKGIGRPSTYAPTISTILNRGYVVREKKLFMPTELGYVTTDLMTEHFGTLINVEFTADMEEQLDRVEEGTENWVQIMQDFYTPFAETLEKADAAIGKVSLTDEVSDVICDKCGRNMVYKMGRFGKFLACPGFPECRNAKPIVTDIGTPCPKCGGKVLERRSKKGRIFYACENSDTCQVVLWDKPTGELCPKCGSPLVSKKRGRSTVVDCSNRECGKTKEK